MALFELPLQNDTSRKIIHLDMDAFYASIEMRDNPRLRHKALVIARDPRTTGGQRRGHHRKLCCQTLRCPLRNASQ